MIICICKYHTFTLKSIWLKTVLPIQYMIWKIFISTNVYRSIWFAIANVWTQMPVKFGRATPHIECVRFKIVLPKNADLAKVKSFTSQIVLVISSWRLQNAKVVIKKYQKMHSWLTYPHKRAWYYIKITYLCSQTFSCIEKWS